jgi:hypothetical protein
VAVAATKSGRRLADRYKRASGAAGSGHTSPFEVEAEQLVPSPRGEGVGCPSTPGLLSRPT